MVTIPNGVDPESFSEPYPPFEERGYVLFVGRIEPHKNQLGLIKALSGSGFPLVIAGYEHPDHLAYDRECRQAGAGWVTFTGQVTPDALPDLFRGARVHVLPTWFETTGLVSLEAALSGCSVVTTSRGYAREYFDDMAWYCDPQEPASILHAVRRAWETPPSPDLRRKVLACYTWKQVAEATIAAYGSLATSPR
jgi:glycosyltransferase involved in cell wall biosynthesis